MSTPDRGDDLSTVVSLKPTEQHSMEFVCSWEIGWLECLHDLRCFGSLPGTRSSRDLWTDEVLSKQFAHITCSSGIDAYDGCEQEGGRGGEAWDGVSLNIFFSSDMEGICNSSLRSFSHPRLGTSMSVYFLERGKAAHLITLSFFQLPESRDSSVMRAWNTPEARPRSLKLSLSSLPPFPQLLLTWTSKCLSSAPLPSYTPTA